jgi:hypothetical protein
MKSREMDSGPAQQETRFERENLIQAKVFVTDQSLSCIPRPRYFSVTLQDSRPGVRVVSRGKYFICWKPYTVHSTKSPVNGKSSRWRRLATVVSLYFYASKLSVSIAFTAFLLDYLCHSITCFFDRGTDVAVVGLPEPRKHHAAVMARFARDCRAKMHELVVELGEKLGEVMMTS